MSSYNDNNEEEPKCNGCHKLGLTLGLKLHKCSGCKMVKYCSRECQRDDWAEHKIECKKEQGEMKRFCEKKKEEIKRFYMRRKEISKDLSFEEFVKKLYGFLLYGDCHRICTQLPYFLDSYLGISKFRTQARLICFQMIPVKGKEITPEGVRNKYSKDAVSLRTIYENGTFTTSNMYGHTVMGLVREDLLHLEVKYFTEEDINSIMIVDPIHMPNTPEFIKGVPLLTYLYLLCDLTKFDIFVNIWMYDLEHGEFSEHDCSVVGSWDLFEATTFRLRHSNIEHLVGDNCFLTPLSNILR